MSYIYAVENIILYYVILIRVVIKITFRLQRCREVLQVFIRNWGPIAGTEVVIRLVLSIAHNSIQNPSLHDNHFAY
jgi:hypothetical protein